MSTDDHSAPGSPTIAALARALADQPGSTVAALALAAGIGRSTAGKLLAQMERAGAARRDPGGHDGTRRLADHWHPAATDPAPTTDQVPQGPVETRTSPEPSGPSESAALPAEASSNEAPISGPEGSGDQSRPTAPAKPATFTGPCPTCGHVRRPSTRNTSVNGRLGQGQLYDLVLQHLHDNPGKECTATGIAKVIGKSSGAIANALAAMAGRGDAAMTCAAPRRYQAVQANGPTVQTD
ncbi:helix-turn-helix domain-containing protein [Streptacidiphilus monticola]|uniref:Helix-turn-helix domain-containing protein n=1 Tax=Streptacidiphilus monticola TaxID=2161674 RepID=A0ABW1G177_9ACTN